MPEQTSIFYACKGCATVSQELRVTARDKKEQDVIRWMDSVIKIISLDHSFHHPECSVKACDLIMPISKDTEGRWIGMPCEPGRYKIPPEIIDRYRHE